MIIDKKIIKEIINETLVSLGFTPKDPQQMQSDLIYLRQLRLRREAIYRRFFIWILTALIPSIIIFTYNMSNN